MADQRAEPVPRTTSEVTQDQIERLKWIFPECVTEGAADGAMGWGLLPAALGELRLPVTALDHGWNGFLELGPTGGIARVPAYPHQRLQR